MDLADGYSIEQPSVVIPWHVTEAELLALLPEPPRHVTTGYYTLPCTSLGGLRHDLGFHFDPRTGGRLHEFELFRRSYPDLRRSFDEFQEHLVATFGAPAEATPGDEGFDHFVWRVGPATVQHYVLYRFGPEEHVRVRG